VDTFLEHAGSEKYASDVNKLLESAEEYDENLKSLLLELFPKLAYAYGRTIYGHQSETEWEKSYRIAAKRYFDAYFSLVLPESDVSVQEITSFISSVDNQAKLDEMLTLWTEKGKLKNAMESLRFRLGEVPQGDLPNVLGALVTADEQASDQGVILAGLIPEYWSVRWAIFDALEAISVGQRVAALKRIFSTSCSLKTITNITALRT